MRKWRLGVVTFPFIFLLAPMVTSAVHKKTDSPFKAHRQVTLADLCVTGRAYDYSSAQ